MNKKRKGINILYLAILFIMVLIGFFAGLSVGIKTGQMMLFDGMGVALADSNINVTIDLTETTIVEGFRNITKEILVPVFMDQSSKNCSNDWSGGTC